MLFIYFFLVVVVNLIKAHSGLDDDNDEAKRNTPSSYTIRVYVHGRGKNGVGNIKG
jgi:hypothetical protein